LRSDHGKEKDMALHKFIIERDISQVGVMEGEQLRAGVAMSYETLCKLSPDVQWLESYVTENKTFCIYLARDEELIRKHAEISGILAARSSPATIERTFEP
jgi:hypothetical protein